MSALEIVGASSAIAALAQQSLQLLTRIQDALRYAESITTYLTNVRNDVATVESVVRSISEEVALQVSDITPALTGIFDATKQLGEFVEELFTRTEQGGGFRRFTRGLLQGPSEQQQLNGYKENLLQAKTTLLLRIQASTVGLFKKEGTTVINLMVVSKVERWLQNLPGSIDGRLNISEYLQQKGVDASQEYYQPTTQELEELLGPLQDPEVRETLAAIPSDNILNNTTSGFSSMFNGYIGNGTADRDAFIVPNRPTNIIGNRARDYSVMVNRGISRNTADGLSSAQKQQLEVLIKANLVEKVRVEHQEPKKEG
ncbi:hypothetical protein CH063_00387 [Colletotrichum higginsianum]|uniref:NACHT-NTPase and P-loop NTPases N-terminal domain-containing protein n=2 Tax=Colletotrichum higginsianum TaxID=80884 RepID=H1VLX6_COLHI|nr:uncharacterized protein CH63R_10488 [Colletotrichum higginsianum IMI 349063]OBR06368.1 hypothetical protein CH63R_10488 [Colletotrichum higginsianum IMI 349063]TIC97479.1 hypothetical protein CH35J_007306 [Colletotrichum higginsianum]GJD04252.1 hypothetical protein ColKHC_13077 [Colletotrichum higginsianum]CCF41229.1 hypothetical protein CH063_00387 [Colletotrichum higginsianum]